MIKTKFFNKPHVRGMILLLMVLFLWTSAVEAKKRIHSKVSIEPTFDLSPKELESVSFKAGQILRYTFLARESISVGKKETAQRQLTKGLLLISQIEKILPEIKITATIRSGDNEYHNRDLVIQTFVPIFDELHHVDILNSVIRSKNEPSTATGKSIGVYTHFSKNRFIMKQLSNPKTRIVTYSGFNHTSVKLDIVLAKQSLALAKKEITRGSMDSADAALLNLQIYGVVLEFSESDLPLADAADLLKQAKDAIMERRFRDAKNVLRAASDKLKKYQESVSKDRSKAVRELHNEIHEWMQVTEEQGIVNSNIESLHEKISEWWRRAVNWLN